MRAAVIVFIMAAVTILLRFLPFLLFSRQTPPYISYLGRVLPSAIIAMLVVYCLRDVKVTSAPFGLPELLAGACVVIIQRLRRNSLLSILAGTIVYMLLVQLVFV